MVTKKGLSYKELNMKTGVLISLGSVSILIAIFGGLISTYNGKKKKKLHYRLTLLYAILSTLMLLIGVILSAIYVRHLNSGDIIFTILAVIFALLLLPLAYGYAFILKKTKALKRLNLT